MNTGDVIERLRRRPVHCVYCTAPARSSEHALPEALGGRLTAEILAHNNQLGARTDAVLFENVRALVNMLRVKRHDGRIGTTFEGTTDAGERVVVTADGRVPGPRLVVEARDERNRIVRAAGELTVLDRLREQGAFAKGETEPVIATPVKPPVVNFGVGSDRTSEAGIVKVALHFVAGFVADIPLELGQRLLPAVLGETLAGGAYVRTSPFDDVLFPASWPPEHRITCWAESRQSSSPCCSSTPTRIYADSPSSSRARGRYVTGSRCSATRRPSWKTMSQPNLRVGTPG